MNRAIRLASAKARYENPKAPSGSTRSGLVVGHRRSWPGSDPHAQQVLGKITHADAPQSLLPNPLAKRRGHPAAFLVIAPKLGVQGYCRRMAVGRQPVRQRANFFPPVMSFLRLLMNIIKNKLLGAVEAHGRQPASLRPENNRKPAPTTGLQFPLQLPNVR